MELGFNKILPMDICVAPDSHTFNNNYGFPARPVLIKNVANHWKAMTAWTPEVFSTRYPDLWVRVVRTDNSEAKVMMLQDYFRYMQDPGEENPYYLKDWVFEEDCPELLQDYDVPSYFSSWLEHMDPAEKPALRWFYIGPAGSGSRMHLDTMDTSAWNAVISGQKHWLFFPAEQSSCVYNGEVDAFHPDFERFPLLAAAEPIYCIQGPGDIVFTPSGYWHQVYNARPGISITENFVNETNIEQVKQYFIQHQLHDELETLQHLVAHVNASR
ncbi:cupin-like domain-containing protein [Chitinophaga pendula]|uniref:cupin-like domain-containing protein n=1 Tax=Chitinophaga TaxID=79328 RepID=UPI000BB053F8|nr:MULTISPECIES: cupin-like domain-containing protein [Chitinophaga]ASZ09478.1 hydroxylase [Chitinophaga sp. MD30]UCJ07592.1 cupin-like domain-containing protein [Chitinophaga pendula]